MIYTAQNIKEFKDATFEKGALLGIDFGTKRIGIAVSDLRLSISTAIKIAEAKDFFKELEKLQKERELAGIVVGLPLLMNGEEGEMAILVREFANKITTSFAMPVLLWDERLSSSAVENFFVKQADLSRKKRKDKIDSSAAGYILQGALDRLKFI